MLSWTSFALWRGGFPSLALSLLRLATKVGRSERSWILRAELEGRLRHERYETVLWEGLARNPSSIELRTALARVLLNSGRTRKGTALADKARSEYPDRPEPILSLASGAIARRDYQTAEALLLEAEQKMEACLPQSVEWFEDLAALLIDMPGQRQWAERVARRTLDEWPHSGWANLMLGSLLSETDERRARTHLRRARRSWRAPAADFERHAQLLEEALHGGAARSE